MNTKSKLRPFTPLEKVRCVRKLSSLTGFTLVELLIIIGIIIILAGIAIPNFNKAKEKALTKEAIANLKLIAAAEKVYRMENATYYGTTDDIEEINHNLRLYFTDEVNWDYAITAASTDAFTAKADRLGGPYSDCIFTIDQSPAEPAATDKTKCP